MISYGSQILIAKTLCGKRSHQLGEGHQCGAAMPTWTHPPRLFYGSRHDCAAMPMEDRSHQLGEGHKSVSEVPSCAHPPRLVYGSQSHGTAMSHLVRSHQLGKGQINHAAVSLLNHPSRPVYGSQSRYAEMPCNQLLPPVYGRDTSRSQQCQMKRSLPTSLREPLLPRSNAHLWSLPLFHERSNIIRRNAKDHTPLKGRVIMPPQKCHSWFALPHQFWAVVKTQQCQSAAAQLILTRGQTEFAEMPVIERLATKEIQYGNKI